MVLALLLYIENRRGPRTELRGAPEVAGDELEILPLTSTNWLLFVRYVPIQVIIVEFKLKTVIFSTRYFPVWYMVECFQEIYTNSINLLFVVKC